MPRYFFDIYDDDHRPDPEGTVLPDLQAAQFEAVILAGYLLQDHASDVLKTEGWHLAVTDASGAVQFRLDVSTTVGRPPQARAPTAYAFRWPPA